MIAVIFDVSIKKINNIIIINLVGGIKKPTGI